MHRHYFKAMLVFAFVAALVATLSIAISSSVSKASPSAAAPPSEGARTNTTAVTSTAGTLWIAGPENAPLTIEEFADLECPFCVRGSATISRILQDYPGKVKLIFRNTPLPMHSEAIAASKAFTAIWLQSPALAYAFQDNLFHNQQSLEDEGEAYLTVAAEKIGANITRMKSDMASDRVAEIIADDRQSGLQHGVQGTPSFLIGSELVVGAVPYNEMKKAVDRQLGH